MPWRPLGTRAVEDMDLALLRTFQAVVRAGGMRRAAEQLHVTQPAISARMRLLEGELGVELFERGNLE